MLENRDKERKTGLYAQDHAELMEISGDLAPPVNTFPDMESDPQVRHNQIVATFDHPKVKQFRTIGPPIRDSAVLHRALRSRLLGEHSREILKEIAPTAISNSILATE